MEMGTCATWRPGHEELRRTSERTAPGVRSPEAGGTDPGQDPRDTIPHETARHESAPYTMPAGCRRSQEGPPLNPPRERGGEAQRFRRLGREQRAAAIRLLQTIIRPQDCKAPVIAGVDHVYDAIDGGWGTLIDAYEDLDGSLRAMTNDDAVLDLCTDIVGRMMLCVRAVHQQGIADAAEALMAEVPA